jgi:hypothetical protein
MSSYRKVIIATCLLCRRSIPGLGHTVKRILCGGIKAHCKVFSPTVIFPPASYGVCSLSILPDLLFCSVETVENGELCEWILNMDIPLLNDRVTC